MISSNITFLYYNDLNKASSFVEEVLSLPIVMNQGFAKIYRVTPSSFLGIVKKENREEQCDTLFSFTVDDVEYYHQIFKKKNVNHLTDIISFDIPLKSFFFEDFEGHRFEYQQFIKKEDKELF
jgi:hypothetical protein